MKKLKSAPAVTAAMAATILATAASARAAAAQLLKDAAIAEPHSGPAAPDASDVASVMRELSSRAGVIFVGQVERLQPNGGVMDIVFNVQQRVSGEVGDTYTLREWSGRWAGGQQRYHVGERAMIFLYPPNDAGISSPVDGMAGVVPFIPMGANEDPLLDIRILATRVIRPVGAPVVVQDLGAMALSDALAIVGSPGGVSIRPPVERPLPPGLRPHPIKSVGNFTGVADPSDPGPILGLTATPDVER
jgi:hypothetical protein